MNPTESIGYVRAVPAVCGVGNGMEPRANFGLRDEIKAYWSTRAATFDAQPGHEVADGAERAAWHALILRHLGRGEGRAALDLGCGTGVVSRLLEETGFAVTGMDWAEPMLERARAKALARGSAARFLLGDAERTLEPTGRYDAVVARHVVWTLVDPPAAFAEWARVLRPGGRLLVVDGDFVTPTWLARLRSLLGRQRPKGDPALAAAHRSILARVHFAGGARADAVARLLEGSGFTVEAIDADLRAIHRAQGAAMPLSQRLDRGAQHRYAIRAVRA